jgi:hypothetical protein
MSGGDTKMTKKYDRLMRKVTAWMQLQHEAGIEWISMQAIYEAINHRISPKQGLTQQQLSNKLPKSVNIERGPDIRVQYRGGWNAGTTWRVRWRQPK